MDDKNLICCKCNKSLKNSKTTVNYMGFNFTLSIPRCPECGLIYISEDEVRNRIAKVEMNFEEK